jgi:GAF domain-containing protein
VQDLYFLNSAADGLDFAVKLLSDLIACEAASACLYDINTDELRFVALSGPGADERRAQAVPATSGILGAAAHTLTEVTAIADAQADDRFDPSVDGRQGLLVRNMLVFPLRSGDTLLGVVQLLNRARRPFTDGDTSVGLYVARQVAEFLQQKRSVSRRPRS